RRGPARAQGLQRSHLDIGHRHCARNARGTRAMRGARAALPVAQLRTVALLFGGYAACYYCRADLSVATPLLVEELGRHGLSHGAAIIRIGSLSSLGVLAYALGKLFLTGLGDYWGGRRNFLIGVG